MSTYTDRYVAAVTRAIPAASRQDVAAELSASIADQIQARTDQGEAHETAEREVLTGLGDPIALAANYSDRPQWVIGPRFYAAWVRLLTVLLAVIVPAAAIGIITVTALTGGTAGNIVSATLLGLVNVGVHVVFWTTLLFLILERSSGAASAVPAWSVEQLSTTKPAGNALTSDVATTVVGVMLFAAAIVWDRAVGWGIDNDHVLAPELWPQGITVLFTLLAVTVITALIAYRTGRWTLPLAITNAIVFLVIAGASLVMLAADTLLDPGLTGGSRTNIAVGLGIVISCAAITAVVINIRKALTPPRTE